MSLYVQVIDGQVVNVSPQPSNEEGWTSAVEVWPPIVNAYQGYNAPSWDTTKTPVELVYTVFAIAVDQHASNVLASAQEKYKVEGEDLSSEQITANQVILDNVSELLAVAINHNQLIAISTTVVESGQTMTADDLLSIE